MNQEFLDNDIIIQRQGRLASITLNNPNKLNALSLEMVRQISSALHQWKDDPEIDAVIFKASEGRAFCSGGDIKSFYYSGMDYRRGEVSQKVPLIFFSEEYYLNKQIANYPKPTIVLMDGITMGGGYGIAGHCQYRIASENTVFAMPEVQIGFFPDVGSIYHLLKAPFNLGRFLALTGIHIKVGDMMTAKLADYYVEANVYKSLFNELIKQEALSADNIQGLIESYASVAPESELLKDAAREIEAIFSPGAEMSSIITQLEEQDAPWAKDALVALRKASPLSVMIAASYLEKAKDMDVNDVLAMDFILVQHFIAGGNMYEGIRAALIDKDKTPLWEYDSYDSVDAEHVNSYFKSTGYDLKDVQIFEE